MLLAENDLAGRAYMKQLMEQAGLAIREDKMGNIYGTLPGADPAAAAVGTGSHCDAIPLAGAYDGTTGGARIPRWFPVRRRLLCSRYSYARNPVAARQAVHFPGQSKPRVCPAGVMGGIAALKALKDAGFVPARPIEVRFKGTTAGATRHRAHMGQCAGMVNLRHGRCMQAAVHPTRVFVVPTMLACLSACAPDPAAQACTNQCACLHASLPACTGVHRLLALSCRKGILEQPNQFLNLSPRSRPYTGGDVHL